MNNRKRWLVWLFVLVIVQCFLPEEYVQAQGEPKTVFISSVVSAYGPNNGQFTVTVPEGQEGVSKEGDLDFGYLVAGEIQVEVTVPAGYDMKNLQVTNMSFEISELNVDFQKKEENVYTFTLTPQENMSIQLRDMMYQSIIINNRSMMRYSAYLEDMNSYVETGEECTIMIRDTKPDDESTLYLVINGVKHDTSSLRWEDADGDGKVCRYELQDIRGSVEVIVADQDSTISHWINLPEGFELYDEEGNQLDKTGSMFQMTGKFGQPFTFLVKGTEEDLNYELYYQSMNEGRIVLEAEPTEKIGIYSYTLEDAVESVYINTEMLDAVRLTDGTDIKMILCNEDGIPLDENDGGRTVFYMKPYTTSYFKLTGTADAYYIIRENSWGGWIIPKETGQGEFIYSVWNYGEDLELTPQAKNRVYLGDRTGVYGDIDWDIDCERSEWDEDEDQFVYYMPYSFETTLFIPEEYVLGDDIELAAHDMDGKELFRIVPKEMEYRTSERGYYCTFAIEDLKVTARLLIEGAGVGVSQSILYDADAFDDVRIRILDADNQEVLPDEDEDYRLVNNKPYRLCLSGDGLEDVTVLYCGEKLKTVVNGKTLEAEFTAGIEYCISLVRGKTYPVAVEAPDCVTVCRRDGISADGFSAEGKLYFYVWTSRDSSAMTITAKDKNGQVVPVTKTEETVQIQIGEDSYEAVDVYAVDVNDSLTIVVGGIDESYTHSIVLPKSTASMQISQLYALDYGSDDYPVAGDPIEGQTSEDGSITYLTNSFTDECEGYIFYITADEEAAVAVKRTDIWREYASEGRVSLRKDSRKECEEGKAVWRCLISTEDNTLGTRIVLQASDQATKVVLREKNEKGYVSYWNGWSYYPERDEESDEIFWIRNLSDALLDISKDTVFEFHSGEYVIAEESLGEFFTAYREENGEGIKLSLKQTEDGTYSCTLPAGYSIIEFDADKLEKKQYRVTLDNTYGEGTDIGLFSSMGEADSAYEHDEDGVYLTEDRVYIKITVDNEALDMLKLNCDEEDNWLSNGEVDEEEGCVWYHLQLYTDATLHISKASSVRLENAAGVTLKSTSFKGNSVTGLASGMPVTIKAVVAEGYQADTVTLKHIYKENGAQKEAALEISDGKAEVTLAPGENRIVAGGPEKQSCRITLPEDDAYTAAPVSGYGPTVKYGEDYKFTVSTAEGYDANTLVVRANGEALEAGADGVYTIENIKKDVNVRIMLSGLTLVEFHNDTEHVTLTGNNGKAEAGAAVSFTVAVDAGYRAESVKVYHTYYENGEKKTAELAVTNGAGNVVLKAGENDITVTTPEKQTYQVVLPTGTGYTTKLYGGSSLTVPYMESMSFKVKADSGYDTQTIVVTVNGTVLEVARGGIYTIENITEDCTVAIAIQKIEEEEPDKPDVPEKPEKAVVYTVTFKGADGKVLKEEKVETGKAASAPAAPDRTGYTFTGWDKSFDKVTTDMTVTAVYKQVMVKEIKISGISKKIAAGKSVTLTAGLAPENALVTDVEWSTSNSKYATVDQKGKVKTKKAGAGKKVTITVQAKDGSGVKASYVIQIQKKAVSKIRLSAKTKTVKAGKKLSIKAKVSPAKNVNKTLLWTSSNTKYAAVSQKGVVTTKKAGAGKKVTITAKATDGSGKKASIKIKIKK